MPRLVIVAGPNRGSAFTLTEGENSIGRQMDNHIVLTSSKVSKRHCALLVTSSEVLLRDEGSTNGTFINGALTKRFSMKTGDKLGVGEFVLELVGAGKPVSSDSGASALNSGFQSNLLPSSFEAGAGSAVVLATAPPQTLATASFDHLEPVQEEPKDLPGKLKLLFEGKLMPNFYGMLMKTEYRSLVAAFMGVALVGVVVGSVMPMQDLAEQSIRKEAQIRGKVLAREIADRFTPNIANHTESQIDFTMLENEESIRVVAITNMDLQIIAPQSRLGQLFVSGAEAGVAKGMARLFREGKERGEGVFVNDHTFVRIEPIKVTDSKQYSTQVVAMVIVAIDFSQNMIESGGLGVAYATGLIIAALIGLLLYFILIRLSAKPYEVLNDDLDQVLRGEIPKVTKEFKIEDTEKLWDNINAAVQRMSKSDGLELNAGTGVVNWEQEFTVYQTLAEAGQLGFVGFDAAFTLSAVNAQFEEISGIRSDAIGQSLKSVADQALNLLAIDLKENAERSPSRMANDNFEFQGMGYQVIAAAVGPKEQPGLAIIFKRKD